MMTIRPILPTDNPMIARIIRYTLTEFNANKPGTAYYDAATDNMYDTFLVPGSRYHVATLDHQVTGGGGIFPSPGLPEGVCELVKMYLSAESRGRGLGRLLLEKNLDFAREYGYRQVYIETMPELQTAMAMYERSGFHYLGDPMGNTGHYGCSVWMLKDL